MINDQLIAAGLNNTLSKQAIDKMEYNPFVNMFTGNLNRHSAVKQKYVGTGQGRLINTTLKKVILIKLLIS